MPIAFEQIPPDILVPMFYAEVTPAPSPIAPALRICLIGHRNTLSTKNLGTATNEVLYPLTGGASNTNSAARLFGAGSQLHMMYDVARANAPFAEIWGIAIDEAVGAVAATGSIEFTTTPTKTLSGTYKVHIAGRAVTMAVRVGDTKADLATRLIGAINNQSLPVRATIDPSDTEIVILTARWNGLTGNDIQIKHASPFGDSSLATIATITQMSGGSGELEAGSALAPIGDVEFDIFVAAPLGNTAHAEFEDFMDHVSGRWSPYKQLYGHVFSAVRGNYATQLAKGNAYNDPHMSIIGVNGSQQAVWEWAAALAGVAAVHWSAPPEVSRPLQTLALKGVYAHWNEAAWFDITERNALLKAGISTIKVANDANVLIDRVRTLRKRSPSGQLDPSWADAVTLFQAMFFVRFMRRLISNTYPRAALTNSPVGINGFTSPSQIKATLIHGYQLLVSVGLVENTSAFIANLVVERNAFDANRVDVYCKPDLANQLRIVAVLVETHLELIDVGPEAEA